MARPAAKLLTGFFIIAVMLLVAALVLTLSQPAPAPPPLPMPNGYDDLLRAGTLVSGEVWNYMDMSGQTLRATVVENEEAVKLAKVGLTRECRAPLDHSPTNAARSKDMAAIRHLAQAMMVTGRLAELEDRPADAMEAYLTAIRLGAATSQGGVLIDSLVGIAIESIGTAALEKLVPTLDAKQCRAAAAALESWESRREPMKTVLARERAWLYRTYGLRERIYRLIQFRQVKQVEQRTTGRVQTQQTRLRGLLVQLASRAYELEKGERPKRLADLVPDYLKAIPQDPLTRTNLAYHP